MGAVTFGPRWSRTLVVLFVLTLVSAVAMTVLAVRRDGFVLLAVAGWFGALLRALDLRRSGVDLGPDGLEMRYAIVSRGPIGYDEIVDLCRRGSAIQIRTLGSTGRRPLPLVADTAGLERAIRERIPALGGPVAPADPEHVVHQGGLVRRWSGPVYD